MALSLLWRVPAARSGVAASILQRRLTISRQLSTTTVATQSKTKDWKLWWVKHGTNAVPDLGKEKATQLYRDGLGALTAVSQNAHSKVKDWKLGRLNQVAIAVPDLKKATQLYRDVLGASGSMLTALSRDIQSKAKDGKLNRTAIIAILLCLGVDISHLESLSDADIFVVYVNLGNARAELDKGKITEAEYKQHIAMRSGAAIGSLSCSKAGALIGTVVIPVPVVGAVVGSVVGCVVGDLAGSKAGEKLYITIRDLTAVRKS